MTYKCSKCGHKSRTFAAMAKHARKHGFKRKQKTEKKIRYPTVRRLEESSLPGHASGSVLFCRYCGGRL